MCANRQSRRTAGSSNTSWTETTSPKDLSKKNDLENPMPTDSGGRDLLFPGMPHDVHKALWKVLNYAGSLSAAGGLLAEYALKTSRK